MQHTGSQAFAEKGKLFMNFIPDIYSGRRHTMTEFSSAQVVVD